MPKEVQTILVVDDDFPIRKVLADIFQDEGYEVKTAPDGQQGLNLVGGTNLTIVDRNMPQMNGICFAKRVRLHYCPDAYPIFLATASFRLVTEEERNFFNQVVEKPFNDIENLIQAVKAHILPRPIPML